MLGDEQLLPAAGLHVQVAVVDEQQLQEVLGQLGGPGHEVPHPQRLWERCGVMGVPFQPPPRTLPLLTHGTVVLAGLGGAVGLWGAAAADSRAVRMRTAEPPGGAMAAGGRGVRGAAVRMDGWTLLPRLFVFAAPLKAAACCGAV